MIRIIRLRPSQSPDTELIMIIITKKLTNGLLVMASIVITVTFQIAVAPPGGFWQDTESSPSSSSSTSSNATAVGHVAGISILYDEVPNIYEILITVNTQAFLASVSLIILLIFPSNGRLKLKSVGFLALYLVVMLVILYFLVVACSTKGEIFKSHCLLVSSYVWVFILLPLLLISK